MVKSGQQNVVIEGKLYKMMKIVVLQGVESKAMRYFTALYKCCITLYNTLKFHLSHTI